MLSVGRSVQLQVRLRRGSSRNAGIVNASVIVSSITYATLLLVPRDSAAQRKTPLPLDRGVFVNLEMPSSSELASAHFLLASGGILDSVALSLNRQYRIPTRIDLIGR